MPMTTSYAAQEPPLTEVSRTTGRLLLEFGTPWCGFCRAAQPDLAAAMATHDGLEHLKIEDGSGRPLGRAFGVKLWPTLVLLEDGREIGRAVRPRGREEISELLDKPSPPAG